MWERGERRESKSVLALTKSTRCLGKSLRKDLSLGHVGDSVARFVHVFQIDKQLHEDMGETSGTLKKQRRANWTVAHRRVGTIK